MKKKEKTIPEIVVGKGTGSTYQIKISKNYLDLEKDKIYVIDYRLIKKVNESFYKNILNSKSDLEELENYLSESDNIELNLI